MIFLKKGIEKMCKYYTLKVCYSIKPEKSISTV